MRGGPLALVLLLAACGHTQTVVSGLQPGVDVAQAALRGGSPQTALSLAGGVLAKDPTNEAALVVQGDALTELNRFNEAGDSYNRALQTNPASVGAEVGLGRLRLANDPAAASVLFLRALDHDPRNTAALNDLGVARDLMGDHAGAQEAYRRALGIDPEDRAAQVNLALSLAMSGAADDAVRMLRPLASNPGASRKLQHDLAAALTMAGDRAEAERILSKDLSPEDVQRALTDYAAARSGGGAKVSVDRQGSEVAVAPMPAPAAITVPPAIAASSQSAPPNAAPVAIASAEMPPLPAAQPLPPVSTPATAPALSATVPVSVTTPTPAPTPTPPVAAAISATPVSAAIPPPASPTVPEATPTTATTPTNSQTAAPPASSATPVTTAAPASSVATHVRLATLHSEDDARAEWRRLRRRMPALLADRNPVFVKTESSGHTLWEVRTGGFTDTAHAKTFCQHVQAAGNGCFVGGA